MSSSSDALAWAWRQEVSRPAAKFLLIALAGESSRVKDGPLVAEPGLARLVRLTGMNESTVVRNLRLLVEAGCVIRERGLPDANGRRARDKFMLPVTVVTSVAQPASSQQAKRKPARILHEGQTRIVPPVQTSLDSNESESQTRTMREQVLKDQEQEPKIKRSSSTASDFETFWSVYPRRVGKRGAESEFERAVKRASVKAVLAGAERYREDPNREDQFTKHPSTWLHQDCWEDDPLPAPRTRGQRDVSPDGMSYTGTDGIVRQMPPSGRLSAE